MLLRRGGRGACQTLKLRRGRPANASGDSTLPSLYRARLSPELQPKSDPPRQRWLLSRGSVKGRIIDSGSKPPVPRARTFYFSRSLRPRTLSPLSFFPSRSWTFAEFLLLGGMQGRLLSILSLRVDSIFDSSFVSELKFNRDSYD